MRITIDTCDFLESAVTMTAATGSSKAAALALGFMAGSFATLLLLSYWKIRTEKEDEEYEAQQLRRKLRSSATNDAMQGGNNSNSIGLIGPTSSFLTDILRELWTHINVAGGDTIRASVEPYFQLYLPGPLKTLHFTKVDLGTNPLQMDNLFVRTITKNGNMIVIEMDIIWNGNSDIQLETDPGPSGIGRLSFGVQNIKLCGQFCLWLKPLVNELPIVSAIQYGFINPPHIDLKFTGLAAVADFAVIDKAVRQSIQSSLLAFVLPNKGIYKLMKTNNFLDTYQPPVGIVRVTAIKGRGFVIEKGYIKDDIPDVYLKITLGTTTENNNTKTTRPIQDNLNPKWDESFDFVLHDRAQKLSIHAWDQDEGPLDADDDLGSASVLISEILLQPKRKMEIELETTTIEKRKKTGAYVTVQTDVLGWTKDLSSLDDSKPREFGETNQIDGLLVVIVNRVYDIPITIMEKRERVCSFVKVSYRNHVFRTQQVPDTPGGIQDALNPMYEKAFEIPILPGMPTSGESAKITLELINAVAVVVNNNKDNSNTKDGGGGGGARSEEEEQVLGALTIALDELRADKDRTLTEKKPIGEGGASIEYRISLSGVARSSSSSSSSLEQQQQQQHEPGATSLVTLPTAAKASISSNNQVISGNSPSSHHRQDDDDDDAPPHPIGRVRLTVVKARGLKISHELFNIDIPDAYCKIKFGGASSSNNDEIVIWKTSTQSNTCNPNWNESKQFDLLDHSQVIALEMLDKNERVFDPDVNLGFAKTTVGKVLLAGGTIELQLTRQGGRPSGIFITLKCELVVD